MRNFLSLLQPSQSGARGGRGHPLAQIAGLVTRLKLLSRYLLKSWSPVVLLQ